MTKEQIEAKADELLAMASKWGEEMGREKYGDAWETMPKGPNIDDVLRRNLIRALTPCSKGEESRNSPVPHDYKHVDDDYGSLGDGGSFEVLCCIVCGRVAYSPLPD